MCVLECGVIMSTKSYVIIIILFLYLITFYNYLISKTSIGTILPKDWIYKNFYSNIANYSNIYKYKKIYAK